LTTASLAQLSDCLLDAAFVLEDRRSSDQNGRPGRCHLTGVGGAHSTVNLDQRIDFLVI
jgi:hypothetical protein